MSTLRSATIRLAYKNPELRPHLLPLLTKQAGRGDVGELVMENDKVRVTMFDHPANELVVQELPSKPVKRRVRQRTYSNGYLVRWFGDSFLMQNVLQDARLSSSMDFDGVARAMDAALEEAKERTIKESGNAQIENSFSNMRFPRGFVYDHEISFLEVEPANYKPVRFRGKDFGGTSEWRGFRFYADKDDDEYMAQMEGMQAFYKETSTGAARKLFHLLKADPDFCKGMTSEQFKKFLVDNKVGYEYVPTVWR
jgi:hypothetical protein